MWRSFRPSAMWSSPYYFIILLYMGLEQAASWIHNSDTRKPTCYGVDKVDRFVGNDSYIDYFKVLTIDHHSMLVGSRNVVYNISLHNLTEFKNQRIEWPPSGPHKELCNVKGMSEESCQNYIRIGMKLKDNQVYICGTNAYKPFSRVYNFSDEGIKCVSEAEAKGLCPYDPNHNSTSLYADGKLYTATVADLSGVDPLIYREPLRTERSDLKQLNDPDFVSSMDYGNYVLFFFRESAVEYINCGKVIYSRVARVCKSDKGGPHQFGDRWTSFIKARLNCSVAGNHPFYFNEIQSTSEIIEGVYGVEKTELIYGVFTTAINSIPGSAVCAFTVNSIMKTFDGPFKEQSNLDSNWLPVPQNKVPYPRPGKCVNDSRTLPDISVNFVKTHSLMDEAVPYFMSPILVHVSLRNRFTAIAVDPQVATLDGQKLDVLFIGTDDGRVVKAVNHVNGKPSALFIEEIQVENTNSAVKSLYITRFNVTNDPPKLLIVTNDVIISVPLYRCSDMTTCRDCVALQDPYCAWNGNKKQCVAHAEYGGFPNKNDFFQNITRGSHTSCNSPDNEIKNPSLARVQGSVQKSGILTCPQCPICEPTQCPNGNGNGGLPKKAITETAVTLGMVAAVICILVALFFGFLAGCFCSRRFRPDSVYSNMPPMHSHQLNRLTDSNINGEGVSYPGANNKAINLVVNVPPKNANDKNANTSSENNKTLQKVKKTYI